MHRRNQRHQEAGLVIPDDISIVGYDGILLSQVLDPEADYIYAGHQGFGQIRGAEADQAIINPKANIMRNCCGRKAPSGNS